MALPDYMTPFARERVAIADAVRISGINKRTLQSMALLGAIPGAAKPAGRWTFDIIQLRKWAQQSPEKVVPCLRTSLSETEFTGDDSRSTDASTEGRYMSVLNRGGAAKRKQFKRSNE